MLKIRRATLADIPQIRQLEEHTVTAAHWSDAQYAALFSATAPARITIIATSDSGDRSLQGFLIARCLPDEWEIENVVVDEAFRRHGTGTSLVNALAGEAQSLGVGSIVLEVRESNRPATRLYESIGFRPDGQRPRYYGDPPEDAILYRLPLQTCDKIP
jgi:ribosomal-protein-alanine N-acetyltransferase